MGIIDNYLEELFGFGSNPQKQLEKIGFVDPNDKSLPNPYNFRQLKLDPRVTKEDLRKAEIEWKKIREKGWAGLDETFQEIYKKSLKRKDIAAQLYTIVDKGKRVGIVGFHQGIYAIKTDPGGSLIYVTWVRGKNYAAAGVMKLLNLPSVPQYGIKGKELNFMSADFNPYVENKASNAVARNLKAKLNFTSGGQNDYSIKAPYWWNNNKLLKH